MRNDKESLKIECQMYFFKKQLVLLSIHFWIQEKEKQKIHFTIANTKNEKV